jgi:quercetin dioxygenase-like cupin family protein
MEAEMAKRISFVLASLVVMVHGAVGLAQIRQNGSGVLIPADGGEKLNPDYGGVLLLKVGPKNSGATELIIAMLEVPVGGSIPTHRHDRDEEVLYVVDGDIALTLNDRQLRASRGDTIFIPVGTWMTVRNSGRAVAKLLGVVPRAEMEQCLQLSHGKGTTSSSSIPSHDGMPDVCHMSVPPPNPRK